LTKKKILVFVDWYVPAFKAGGPVRSVYNLVTRFADKYDFYIVTGDRDLGDEIPFLKIRFNEWQRIGNSNIIYVTRKEQKLTRFKTIIQEVSPDIIYLNSLFSFTFTLQPLWLKKKFPDIKYVLAPRGMLGKGSLEIKKKKKEVFIALARLIKLYKGIYWHATNEKEKGEIEHTFGKHNEIIVADNVATEPRYSFEEIIKFKKKYFREKRFLIVSRISRIKNIDKLIEWFLQIDSASNFTLSIIGSVEDKEYYNELLVLIGGNERISIKSAIHPDNLARIYAGAHFFCLPTRHENFGHVIIEALSYACPVIISQRTPWRNLESENIGWDLTLERPDHFISVMKECIEMDEERYLNMSESAYIFAQEHINKEDLSAAYYKLLA
jgi:glycosyltransferase involved in cell wall biosynthesis